VKKIDRALYKRNVPTTDEVWQHDAGDHYRVRTVREEPSAEIARLLPEHVKHVVTVACTDSVGDVVKCANTGRHVIFGRHELYTDPARMRLRSESPVAQTELWKQRLIERARSLEIMRRNLAPLITATEWVREIPTPYGLRVRVHGADTTVREVMNTEPDREDFVNFKIRLEVIDENDAVVTDSRGSPFGSAGVITLPLAELLARGEDETAALAERLEREANMIAVAAANYRESMNG
jgi:hypothetical protein